MTFLGKIGSYAWNVIKNLSVTDPKAWGRSLWNLYGAQSLSGEIINEYTALNLSAYWNGVALIAGTVSTLPLHLLRKDQKKTIMADEKRLFRVLHNQFNPYMTAQVGREVMTAHVLTWGNCYAEKVRNGYGEIVELWPIGPNRVRMEMIGGEIVYWVNVDSEEIPLKRDKILHIPGLGFDGFTGYSVVAMARKSLGLTAALETFGSLYFGKGTHPGGIVTHPNTLKDPKAFREAFNDVYTGLGKSQQIMLLQEGMKFDKVGIPPEDSQFLESKQFQIPEIARWLNLPPHKLKDLTRSSFNNIESEQISFVTDSILPWLIRFEQNYDMQLLTESEQLKQKMFTRHNVDGLMRGNAKDRAEYYKIMWGNGFYTQNEVRELENKDPHENPLADELFIMTNMIPLNKIDEYLAQQKGTKNTEVTGDESEQKPVQAQS